MLLINVNVHSCNRKQKEPQGAYFAILMNPLDPDARKNFNLSYIQSYNLSRTYKTLTSTTVLDSDAAQRPIELMVASILFIPVAIEKRSERCSDATRVMGQPAMDGYRPARDVNNKNVIHTTSFLLSLSTTLSVASQRVIRHVKLHIHIVELWQSWPTSLARRKGIGYAE